MRCAFLGFGQTFGVPGSVRALPENREIAVTIGLKGQTLAIRGPDGETISAAEREPPHGSAARQIVNVDDRLLAIIGFKRDALAVRRNSGVGVGARWKSEGFDLSSALDQSNRLLRCALCRGGAWDINERSVIRDAEFRRSIKSTTPDSFNNGNGAASEF